MTVCAPLPVCVVVMTQLLASMFALVDGPVPGFAAVQANIPTHASNNISTAIILFITCVFIMVLTL